jgi:hypothetical protein
MTTEFTPTEIKIGERTSIGKRILGIIDAKYTVDVFDLFPEFLKVELFVGHNDSSFKKNNQLPRIEEILLFYLLAISEYSPLSYMENSIEKQNRAAEIIGWAKHPEGDIPDRHLDEKSVKKKKEKKQPIQFFTNYGEPIVLEYIFTFHKAIGSYKTKASLYNLWLSQTTNKEIFEILAEPITANSIDIYKAALEKFKLMREMKLAMIEEHKIQVALQKEVQIPVEATEDLYATLKNFDLDALEAQAFQVQQHNKQVSNASKDS